MDPREWIKGLHDTAELLPCSTFDYLEGKPFADMRFAGLDSCHVIDRAFINPYDAKSVGLECYGALSDDNGLRPTYTYHLRVSKRKRFVIAARRPLPIPLMQAPEYLPGRWLYGGELMHHFGHFMSESSHRLYALTSHGSEMLGVGAYDGAVFSSRASLKPFQRSLLCDYYGIPEEKLTLVRDRPIIVEQLEIRPQGSILGGGALSGPYVDILQHYQTQNKRRITRDHPRRIFLGRSHLTTGGGHIRGEEALQSQLEMLGFTAVQPELLPLLEQLEMMRTAEVIVAVGGSFVHLYDHLGDTDTAMFLISRGDPDSFYHHRSLLGKVGALSYYEPVPGRDGGAADIVTGGRTQYVTHYDMEALLDAVRNFVAEHHKDTPRTPASRPSTAQRISRWTKRR